MTGMPTAKTCFGGGILPIIPPKANRREPLAYDFRVSIR
ncbi:hypothetical protein ABIB28_000598 [Sphingomonas sp. UYEF23]